MSRSVDAMPAFSVIVPTFQRNELLAKCLECLAPGQQNRAQMWTPNPRTGVLDQASDGFTYEVIVADDGRRSTAQAMIREKFPWARWVAGPRTGPAANRNVGAEVAGGKWLAFTDDDCLPDSTWLAAYWEAIRKVEAEVYEGKTYTEEKNKGNKWTAPVNTTGGCLWSCNFVIKRSLFLELGGFDARYPYPHLEDVDLRERLRAKGYQFPFQEAAAVFHPLRPVGSLLSQARAHESYFYFARKHGISVKAAGLSPAMFVKARVRWMMGSADVPNFFWLVWRSFVESILVSLFSIRWKVKYRR